VCLTLCVSCGSGGGWWMCQMFAPSHNQAVLKLMSTTVFCLLSWHCLNLAPDWALPACWCVHSLLPLLLLLLSLLLCPAHSRCLCCVVFVRFFAAISFSLVFEIGHDCVVHRFFRWRWLNELVGACCLALVFQPSAHWKHETQHALSLSAKKKKQKRQAKGAAAAEPEPEPEPEPEVAAGKQA
jgi:hypothetical protein